MRHSHLTRHAALEVGFYRVCLLMDSIIFSYPPKSRMLTGNIYKSRKYKHGFLRFSYGLAVAIAIISLEYRLSESSKAVGSVKSFFVVGFF